MTDESTPPAEPSAGGAPGRHNFTFPDEEGPSTERLDATRLASGYYRLEMSPIMSELARYGDVVEVDEVEDGLLFRRKVAPSGLRSHQFASSHAFVTSPLWEALKTRVLRVGGQWEQVFGGILILHVPHDSALDLQREVTEAHRLLSATSEANRFFDPEGRVVMGEVTGSVVCIPQQRAEALRALLDLNDRAMWAEVERVLPPAIWNEVRDRWHDPEGEFDTPPPDSIFHFYELRGVEDGDWPWPAQEMADWIPASVLEQFGHQEDTRLNGSYRYIPESDIEAFRTMLIAHGYQCTRDDKLVQRLSGY